jgi:hypothetical protein
MTGLMARTSTTPANPATIFLSAGGRAVRDLMVIREPKWPRVAVYVAVGPVGLG